MSYLKTDGKKDIKKYNIRTDNMTALDYNETSQLEQATRIITDLAVSMYGNYLSEDLNGRDFKVDMYSYMNSKKAERIQETMLSSYTRLNDGSDLEDVSASIRSSLSDIDNIYDTAKIRSIDMQDSSEEAEMRFQCKTGIPCIDGDIGGVYTRLIYTLTAQPGGGKTRLGEAAFVYNILTEAKEDVLAYSTELTTAQFKNILVAYHIIKIYGERFKIPDSIMNKKSEMSEQQRQIYEAAKIDLFESGKYGKLYVKENCVVETLKDEILNTIRVSGNLGHIMIDYMGLAKSVPESKWDKALDQYEIITRAYEIVRDILKSFDMSALCINQFNDKGIDAVYAGRPVRSGYTQGGHIVQRHTDYDMYLTFTEEQRLAGVRGFSCPKARGAKGFENILLSVDLSVSIFRQELRS